MAKVTGVCFSIEDRRQVVFEERLYDLRSGYDLRMIENLSTLFVFLQTFQAPPLTFFVVFEENGEIDFFFKVEIGFERWQWFRIEGTKAEVCEVLRHLRIEQSIQRTETKAVQEMKRLAKDLKEARRALRELRSFLASPE